MKKALQFICIALLAVFSLTSCGKDEQPSVTSSVNIFSDNSSAVISASEKSSIQSSQVLSSLPKASASEKSSYAKSTASSKPASSQQTSSAASSAASMAQAKSQTVYISATAMGKQILNRYEYGFDGSKTVFDALKESCAANEIKMKYSGFSGLYYVKSIADYAEFANGPGSGWIYKVNGEKPNISCGKYNIKNGDIIEWIYSLNYGNDIN